MNTSEKRKTVNVALIGAGFIGGEHAKGYALASVCCPDIAATPVRKILCEVDEEKAKERAKLWGFEEYCTDYHEILKRDDIDIVDVCTKEPTHAQIVCDLIKEQKFFIACEKPLVSTLEDGEKIMKAIDEYNWDSHTAVSFNKRRFQAVTYARDVVKSGKLGEILMFHGRYNGGRITTTRMPWQDYRICSGYANCMSHLADLCAFILDDHFDEVVGEVNHVPKMVLAHAPQPGENAEDIPMVENVYEDYGLMIAKMKSGLTATLIRESCYLGCLEDISYEILGTKGSLRWNAMNCNCVYYCDGADPQGERGFKEIHMGTMHPYGHCLPPHQGFAKGVSDQFAMEAYDIVNACVRGECFQPTMKSSYEIVKVCQAARESTKNHGWVKVDSL